MKDNYTTILEQIEKNIDGPVYESRWRFVTRMLGHLLGITLAGWGLLWLQLLSPQLGGALIWTYVTVTQFRPEKMVQKLTPDGEAAVNKLISRGVVKK